MACATLALRVSKRRRTNCQSVFLPPQTRRHRRPAALSYNRFSLHAAASRRRRGEAEEAEEAMKAEEVEEAEKQALIDLRRGWAYGGGGQGEGVLFTGAGEEGGRGGWGGERLRN